MAFRAIQSVLETDLRKEHENCNRLKAQKMSLGSSQPNVQNYTPRYNKGLLSRPDGATYAAFRLRSMNSVNTCGFPSAFNGLTDPELSLYTDETLLLYK